MGKRISSILVAALLICLANTAHSQKILKTGSGQKVLIAVDGSWSIVKKTEKVNEHGQIIQNDGTSLDAFQAPSQGKHPLTVEEKSLVENHLLTVSSDEAQLLVNLEFFRDNLKKLEAQKSVEEKAKNKPKVEQLKGNIEALKVSIKEKEKSYKLATSSIKNINKLLAGKVKDKEKSIAQLTSKNEIQTYNDSGMGGALKADDAPRPTADKNIERVPENLEKAVHYPKTFKVKKDEYPRDKFDCEIVFDGYDEAIGSKKKEVKTEFFFGFSQKKMKSYFKSDDYITCDANVSKIGKHTFLTLNLRVKSKDAKKNYGMLKANETIRLEMIDGSKVYCRNVFQDAGTIEAYSGHTLYTGVFQIEKEDIGKLKKGYLDNIGVIWSSGFEEYNIFNIDFLKNQLSCLEN